MVEQKVASFDRDSTSEIMLAIKKSLASVEAKYGITINTKGGTYRTHSFKMIISATLERAVGQEVSPEMRDTFTRFAGLFGLMADDLEREVEMQGFRGKIIGLRPRAQKKLVIVRRLDNGLDYIVPVAPVLRALGRGLDEVSRERFLSDAKAVDSTADLNP